MSLYLTFPFRFRFEFMLHYRLYQLIFVFSMSCVNCAYTLWHSLVFALSRLIATFQHLLFCVNKHVISQSIQKWLCTTFLGLSRVQMVEFLNRKIAGNRSMPRLQSCMLSCLSSVCKHGPVKLPEIPYRPRTGIRWLHDHFSLYMVGSPFEWHHHRAWRPSLRQKRDFESYIWWDPICVGTKSGQLWFLTICDHLMFLVTLLLSCIKVNYYKTFTLV